MAKKEPKVDAYIKKAAPFAQPILNHMRELIFKHCPDVEEVIKWSFPCYEYKGPIFGIAAFKEHCAMTFFKAPLMKSFQSLPENNQTSAGHLGKIRSLKDLPSEKILTGYIKEAVEINEKGLKVLKKKSEPKELIIPEALTKMLNKNKKAKDVFEAFPYSHKKEYVDWIADAKTDATRDKRLDTTLEWLIEGKSRMWKYQSKK